MYRSSIRTQTSTKAQIVDQNYAHGTLFMAMSTLEEIQQKLEKNTGAKEFGRYDIANYSWKDLSALKSQLKTQLRLLEISFQ